MHVFSDTPATGHLPEWVPAAACNYLAHTQGGHSLRMVAKSAGCHPSTILRQVRRIEASREDPLVDHALRRLAVSRAAALRKAQPMPDPAHPLDQTSLALAARDVLQALCRRGAILAVSPKMDTAVVVQAHGKTDTPPVSVDRSLAEAMALTGWLTCAATGNVARYRISGEGRAALQHLLAQSENAARQRSDMADPDAPVRPRSRRAAPRAIRHDPPFQTLARRREKDGSPFLRPELVEVGDRLREDFVISDLGPDLPGDWADLGLTDTPGVNAARDRLKRAMQELGPGLGDIALRCCCLQEGLEAIEKDLNWAQRSGKIVLRIALQRLRVFYDDNNLMSPLIG